MAPGAIPIEPIKVDELFCDVPDELPIMLLQAGEQKEFLELVDKCPALDLNWQDEDGNTALHYAVTEMHMDALLQLTKESRIDLNIVNNQKQTALA